MNCFLYNEMKAGEEKYVSDMVWEVFKEFVAPGYSTEGIETFRSFIQADELKKATESGRFFTICCWDGEALVGSITMRDSNHISLLFVKKDYHRQGIAKELFNRALQKCKEIKPDLFEISVNSSPYAIDIYKKLGFSVIGEQTTRDGITYIPMNIASISYQIIPMDGKHLCDINKSNQPFSVFGRLIPTFAKGEWTWTEELFETPYKKQYPDDELDYSEYISNPDKTIFMVYMDIMCAGQIRLRRNWNKYCYIEDIAVGREYRGMGLGRKLINAAIQWAKEGGMPGLMLETQDINLAACRFYHRCGFVLGAVDTMLYGNCPSNDEKALFWYMLFQ